jgi:hypothetical protein
MVRDSYLDLSQKAKELEKEEGFKGGGKYIYLRTEASLGTQRHCASVGGDGGGDLIGRAVLGGVVTDGGGRKERRATGRKEVRRRQDFVAVTM